MNQIKKNIKNYFRQILALMIIMLFFLISKSFPATIIKSENCTDGQCGTLSKSSLSDENMIFFADDVMSSSDSTKEYYELIFNERADKDSKILIKASTALTYGDEIGSLDIKKNSEKIFQKIIFSTEKKATDIGFSKVDKDGSDIFISNVRVFKLNVSSDKELTGLRQTIFGQGDYSVVDQEQDDNSQQFSRLAEPDIIFGQYFKPDFDYITGVSLSIDVMKQDNWKTDSKYSLELREAQDDDGTPVIKSKSLASKSFTLDTLEDYRQPDGTFKFPIFAKLDPEKSYFIGINNDKVDVNRFNHLVLRGTMDDNKYENGHTLVKYNGMAYFSEGDLYFKTYGIKFAESDGKKVLQGAVIVDAGKGSSYYSYRPNEEYVDLADIYWASNEVGFNEEKSIISGNDGSDYQSSFVYKFETIYPLSEFIISAKQPDLNWRRVSIYYSFDDENWNKIPEAESVGGKDTDPQRFNFKQIEKTFRDVIYLKVQPESYSSGSKADSKSYGVENLSFEANLKTR